MVRRSDLGGSVGPLDRGADSSATLHRRLQQRSTDGSPLRVAAAITLATPCPRLQGRRIVLSHSRSAVLAISALLSAAVGAYAAGAASRAPAPPTRTVLAQD